MQIQPTVRINIRTRTERIKRYRREMNAIKVLLFLHRRRTTKRWKKDAKSETCVFYEHTWCLVVVILNTRDTRRTGEK